MWGLHYSSEGYAYGTTLNDFLVFEKGTEELNFNPSVPFSAFSVFCGLKIMIHDEAS